MIHDKLLNKLGDLHNEHSDFDAPVNKQYLGMQKLDSALRAVVKATEYPPTATDWQWIDGWKCAMQTIIQAIEKEIK
jgi:hypothetical protein